MLPRAAARAPARRPRRGVRHRAGLRHAARAGHATTRSSPRASTGRWPRSTRRCSTSCGSAPTSCSRIRVPAARRGRRDRRAGPGGARATGRASSSTRCCARSPRSDLDALARARSRPTDDDGPARPPRASRTSHPRWIVARARATRSAATVDRRLAGAAGRRQRARPRSPSSPGPGRSTVDELLAAGGRAPAAGRRTPCVLAGGDPGALAAVRDGRAGVQDEGSQLVALALAARAASTGRDARWLDLCAGPGGKAALLAALAAQRGARADRRRAAAAPRRAGRAGAGRRPRPVRGASPPTAPRPPWAARRLRPGPRRRARAPASARCAAGPRRAGGARPRTSPRSRRCSASCSRAALDAVRPGGVVAYVTCSPHLAETRRRRRRRAARGATTSSGSTPAPLLPGRARPRRRPGRPALAAPARHRRDVPRPAAPTTWDRRDRRGPHVALAAPWRVQISPSILSADFARLADEVAGGSARRRLAARRRHGQPLRART